MSSREKQFAIYVAFVQLMVLGLGVYYIIQAHALLNSSDTSIDFLSQITTDWQVQPFIEITETTSTFTCPEGTTEVFQRASKLPAIASTVKLQTIEVNPSGVQRK